MRITKSFLLKSTRVSYRLKRACHSRMKTNRLCLRALNLKSTSRMIRLRSNLCRGKRTWSSSIWFKILTIRLRTGTRMTPKFTRMSNFLQQIGFIGIRNLTLKITMAQKTLPSTMKWTSSNLRKYPKTTRINSRIRIISPMKWMIPPKILTIRCLTALLRPIRNSNSLARQLESLILWKRIRKRMMMGVI